jgi:rhomboid family GlyGly-CTERM serine protease
LEDEVKKMWVVAAVAIASVAATFVPGESLELHRNTELWRIVTCHFTHFSYEQLAWDALAFTLLAAACARRNRGAFHATLLASIVLIPLAVWAFAPQVTAYRGLSGLASAMFALLLMLERHRLTWPVALLAIGFGAKLIFEAVTGGTVFVDSMGDDVVSVPVAHLAGALVGVIGGLPRKKMALLAPLLLTSCVSIPLPIPALSGGACSTAKELFGRWSSQRITQLGPADVDLVLRDDCRFVMRIGLPFRNIEEEGTYKVENDQLLFNRRSGQTVWPIRRDKEGRLHVQEAPNEWHTYTHDPCASFWPCSSR